MKRSKKQISAGLSLISSFQNLIRLYTKTNRKKTMKQFNTIGRCCIAAACIILSLTETQESFAVIILFEIISGIFLFVNYKVQIVIPILIGIRILASLYDPTSIFENVAIIGGLLLLLDESGKSLLEIMEPDIQDLPEYKTKF